MPAGHVARIAIHVCADVATRGIRRCWPPPFAAPDTLERIMRVCQQLGIAEQHVLAGEQATAAALQEALRAASTVMAGDGGLVMLSFSGHTERGDGPIETACWCLVGGGVELAQIAQLVAQLPLTTRVLLICDTCYAAAITEVLVGAQPVVVVASCSAEQTMVDRLRSEFVVRLEEFVRVEGRRGSLAMLRAALEADTPDCERPVVWSNTGFDDQLAL